jgi:hypothetical protein
LLALLAPCNLTFAGVFDIGEITVAQSPAEVRSLEFEQSEKVLDFDVAKNGPQTAILIEKRPGGYEVFFWDPSKGESPREWPTPKGFAPLALAWHPAAKSFFLAGKQGNDHVIMRVNEVAGEWIAKPIYRTHQEIRRLVPAPRPYAIETDFNSDEPTTTNAYRIFFGIKGGDGAYSIKSVTEEGTREYQAIGPRKGFTTFEGNEAQPSRIEAGSALPLAFHPAGHILLWEDEKRGFQYAIYERDHWEKSIKLSYSEVSGGTLTPSPNGLGLIHWQPGTAGITLISRHGMKRDLLAADYSFLSTPSSVPDGKGIVGLIKKDKKTALAYVPLQIPLADVANAWMFAEQEADQDLFSRKGGLLRDLPDDQLYSMYESEAYECGRYDRSTPTRPYMVTTDVFWELLAAAHEGIFIVQERHRAMPAFWEFIGEAESYFRQARPDSPWMNVFSVLESMRKPDGATENEKVRSERLRIQNAAGREFSPVLGKEVDYGELKPRGHYNSSEEMKTYFRAFKYLTMLAGEALSPGDPAAAAPEVKAAAHRWVAAYDFFIAPSRAPTVWEDKFQPPPYAKHPLTPMKLFPLSWGGDNEVLFSTVYHQGAPDDERVEGASGPRLLPSGLDIASALGSQFASALLSTEIEKYPPLKRVLDNLRTRLAGSRDGVGDDTNIYNPWIAALALQWADDVASPGGSLDKDLWHAKRLQTGLASWATLRHTTVLVNERTSAECGEAAFEPILLTPPRGYVEPDPRTFDAIATLFQSMERLVKSWDFLSKETVQIDDEEELQALREGIVRRLSETAEKARLFKIMAEKEIKGEPLSNQEYEEILLVGRIAEHHLLIFKSLANEQYALSNPDPMPKIADVAGGGPFDIPFLMAAVGRPMEWDHIVPYYGRRQIAKGAVYSYYEFVSEQLMDDAEWLRSLPSRQHPAWISPFLSRSSPACPPRNPY